MDRVRELSAGRDMVREIKGEKTRQSEANI